MSNENTSIKIGLKPFLLAVGILLALIIVSGIITRVLPSGEYQRVFQDGREIVIADSYTEIEKVNYPIIRWFTAPVEVIWGDNWLMVMVLSLFMFFIGGSFTVLEQQKVIEALLAAAVIRFRKNKYLLMGIIIFVLMFLASVIGIYEALVPLIIFIVPFALIMGWDSLTGLGMTLLALSFGFAAAVTNPFTIAVAQKIAGLPIYSGSWLRIIFFIFIFIVCYYFVYRYARKVEKNPEASLVYKEDLRLKERYSPEKVEEDLELMDRPGMKSAIRWFSICIVIALAVMLTASLVPAVPTDLAFPFIALMFLLGGIGAGKRTGLHGVPLFSLIVKGALNMLPGIVLILMAMSVPHIMVHGGVMDTILFYASSVIRGASPLSAGFLVYVLTLILNFFISSASAKAFLVMPILTPLADLVGLTRQTVVLAFDLGDGFSNMIFPTNALLMIGLSFTIVSYPKWLRWTLPLQIFIIIVSLLLLTFAVNIGFGPF